MKVFLDSDQNLPPSSEIVFEASTTFRNAVHTPGRTKRKGDTVVKISILISSGRILVRLYIQ